MSLGEPLLFSGPPLSFPHTAPRFLERCPGELTVTLAFVSSAKPYEPPGTRQALECGLLRALQA